MDLLFPVNNKKSVSVSELKIKVIKIASDQNNIHDGSLFVKLLCAISDLTPVEAEKVALIDAYRVLFNSWIKSHNCHTYIKQCACKCGNSAIFIKHDLSYEPKNSDVYNKIHRICEKDVKLAPFTLSFVKSALLGKPDLLGVSNIYSIDGNTTFDVDDQSISLYSAVRDLVKEDEVELYNFTNKKVTCSCGESVVSDIGFHNADFLMNRK